MSLDKLDKNSKLELLSEAQVEPDEQGVLEECFIQMYLTSYREHARYKTAVALWNAVCGPANS